MLLSLNQCKKLVWLMPLFLLVIAAPQSALALEGQGSATGLAVQAKGPVTANLQAVNVSESNTGPFHTTNEAHNVSLLDGDITAGVITVETVYAPVRNQIISLALTNNLVINLNLVPFNGAGLPLNLNDLPLNGVGLPLNLNNLPLNGVGLPLGLLNAPLDLLHNLTNVPLGLLHDLLKIPLDLLSIPLGGAGVPLNLVRLSADNITSAASVNGLCGSLVSSGGVAFKGLTLSILGIPVTPPLKPAPNTELLNTTLELASGTGGFANATAEILVIANEQIVNPHNSSITINGLHIKIKWKSHIIVNGGTLSQDLDIVIARSHVALDGC